MTGHPTVYSSHQVLWHILSESKLHAPLFIHTFDVFCYVFSVGVAEACLGSRWLQYQPTSQGNIKKTFNKISGTSGWTTVYSGEVYLLHNPSVSMTLFIDNHCINFTETRRTGSWRRMTTRTSSWRTSSRSSPRETPRNRCSLAASYSSTSRKGSRVARSDAIFSLRDFVIFWRWIVRLITSLCWHQN